MLEALWSVQFGSSLGLFGAGVVVFETGRIFGGDGQYYWTGNYKVENGVLNGHLDVVHYAGQPWSIFGPSTGHSLSVSGPVAEDKFELEGQVVGNPTQRIRILLTKRADLP